VNSLFQSSNTWCWSEKHDLALNFNVAKLSLQRSVYGSASGESKKEYSSFRSSMIFLLPVLALKQRSKEKRHA
jgi:hypothetical protein